MTDSGVMCCSLVIGRGEAVYWNFYGAQPILAIAAEGGPLDII